jgi:[acyl-carrier-protein] S-malonyltransferase
MKKAAFLFPGQGSQFVGMGRDLYDSYPAVRDLYDRADEVLGTELRRISFRGPLEELTLTRNAQPAILLHSVGVLLVARDRGLQPTVVAGHSLGEFSALVAAGTLDPLDAARIVRRRGELMYDAGERRPGTMAAVLGLEEEVVSSRCARAAEEAGGEVVVANLNAPGQVVISGDVGAVERAMEKCRDAGAARVVPLQVSGAFHSPLMEPAREGLAEYLEAFSFREPRATVVVNVTGRVVSSAAEIRGALTRQLTSPVRWSDSMQTLTNLWEEAIVEAGPGRVLAGLMRKIDRRSPVTSVGDVEALEKLTGSAGTSAAGS